MQCSIGCGGQACKYDNPSYWSDDQQAIKGLYSSWYAYVFYLSSCDSMEIVFHVNYFSKITSYFLLTSHVAVVGLTSVDYFLIYSPLTFFPVVLGLLIIFSLCQDPQQQSLKNITSLINSEGIEKSFSSFLAKNRQQLRRWG